MPTNYPAALDAFGNPNASGGDTLADVPHDSQHGDANDAIEAIETELGINPRGSEATVRARLDAIESATSDVDTRHEEHHYAGAGVDLTTGFQNVVDVTFAPPVGWATYTISAAGQTFLTDGTVAVHTARVVIAGAIVGVDDHGTSEQFKMLMPSGSSTGLSGNSTVQLQAKSDSASGAVRAAQLSIHARRLT